MPEPPLICYSILMMLEVIVNPFIIFYLKCCPFKSRICEGTYSYSREYAPEFPS